MWELNQQDCGNVFYENELFFREFCLVCKSHNSKILRRGNFNLKNLKPEDFKITDNRYGLNWTFYRCLDCGFVYANPLLSEKSVFLFYSMLEDEDYDSESENRQKNFRLILKRIRKLKPEAETVLDVGAANGIFLDLAAKAGWKVAGIEPSKYLVQQAKNKYKLDLFCGTLEQYQSKEKYDVITVLDLIEHVLFPDKLIENVSRFLKKDGLLVLVTPDIRSFFARIMGRKWWHFRIAHVNFFSSRNLKRLLQDRGFKIVMKKCYLWHFSLWYLLTRIIRKERIAALQNVLKKINLKLPLADSVELYAVKTED